MGKHKVVCMWKGPIKDISHLEKHAKYIGYRSHEMDQKGHFSKDKDHYHYKKFIERVEHHSALQHELSVKAHKLIFSLREKDYNAYLRSGKDYKDLIRATMEDYEKQNDVKLDWIANIHTKDKDGNLKENPHCHVIVMAASTVKGDRGYKRVKFNGKRGDFDRLKDSFDKHFEKDVQYTFLERMDTKEIERGFRKMVRQIGKQAEREIERENLMRQVQEERQQKRTNALKNMANKSREPERDRTRER